MKSFTTLLLACICAAHGSMAIGQEAVIRRNLSERVPQFAPITEISKTELPGIYEVKINQAEIIYTDSQANFMFLGKMVDIKGGRNVTDERLSQLPRVRFRDLPIADAVTIVRGNGARKLAIFEDPNCVYCKAYEKDLSKVTNVTIHIFYYPVLGPDSFEKAKALWCAPDRGKAWQDWIQRNQAAPAASPECDTAPIFRNLELGKRVGAKGTPANIFPDDSLAPGALELKQLEKRLTSPRTQ